MIRVSGYNGLMVESAGVIVVDFSGAEPKALCLLSGFKSWDFPKGHVEPGETLFEAALRETEEECGLSHEDFRISQSSASTLPYKVPEGLKVATYFFSEKISEKVPFLPINPSIGKPEHIAWRWFPVRTLYEKMPRRLQPVVEKLEVWVEGFSTISSDGSESISDL